MRRIIVGLIVITLSFIAVAQASSCNERLEQAVMSFSWPLAQELKQDPRCKVHGAVATWFHLKDGNRDASFKDYIHFIESHPNWPWLNHLRKNAEAVAAAAPPAELIKWFHKNPPNTGEGVLAYLEALRKHHPKQLAAKARELWIHGDFSSVEEKDFINRYGRTLEAQDHIRRVQHLLTHKNIKAVKRMMNLVPVSYRPVVQARIALINYSENAPLELAKVSKHLTSDPHLARDYLHWLRKKNDPRAFEFLLKHKTLLAKDAKRLWKETHILMRRAMEAGDHKLALRLVDNHGLIEVGDYAEAEWLKGWLTLKVIHNAEKALPIFEHLYAKVTSPISRSRMAYWAAQAGDKFDPSSAHKWYQKAAQFPTTFYGQQAARHLKAMPILKRTPMPGQEAQDRFNRRELVQVIKMLQHTQLARHNRDFLFMLVKTVPIEEKPLCIRLAKLVDTDYCGQVAREASQSVEIIMEETYPWLAAGVLKNVAKVDLALVHAVIRKESRFDPRIESPAGALGLMQVMPNTGRMLAKNIGVAYSSEAHLKDAEFNVQLGSEYLRRQLERFDGSTVLALAAYNAGAKPVLQWIECFGDPRLPDVDIIDWIEKIPYGETRNYVQRVLEAYGVYKTMYQNKNIGG